MINNFKVQQRLCSVHAEECPYILIESSRMRLICQRCLPLYNSPNQQNLSRILSINKFKDYLQTIVVNQQAKIKLSQTIDIRKIISEKKKDFEEKQFKIVDQIMKRIQKDKETFFGQLEVLQRYFNSQQARFIANLQRRSEIIKYLKQFCQSEQLLKLKLMISNEYGLNSFISEIKSLQILSQQHSNRSPVLSKNELLNQINFKQQNLFLRKLDKTLQSLCQGLQQVQKINIPLSIGRDSQTSRKRPPSQNYGNQITDRTQKRNQSLENIAARSPKTSRMNSFAHLPKFIVA